MLSNPTQQVLTALANPKYDFRTIEGIAKETGLQAADIQYIIERNTPDYVRVCAITDNDGRRLYTRSARGMKLREILATAQQFIRRSSS